MPRLDPLNYTSRASACWSVNGALRRPHLLSGKLGRTKIVLRRGVHLQPIARRPTLDTVIQSRSKERPPLRGRVWTENLLCNWPGPQIGHLKSRVIARLGQEFYVGTKLIAKPPVRLPLRSLQQQTNVFCMDLCVFSITSALRKDQASSIATSVVEVVDKALNNEIDAHEI